MTVKLRRTSTLPRTTGYHKGDDISGGQVLKIQGATVSREAALEERAHHIGIAAGRGSRQSALDGQVAPEPIEHDIDWTEDGILIPFPQRRESTGGGLPEGARIEGGFPNMINVIC